MKIRNKVEASKALGIEKSESVIMNMQFKEKDPGHYTWIDRSQKPIGKIFAEVNLKNLEAQQKRARRSFNLYKRK